MAITVPASDSQNYNLQAAVTAMQAQVTANVNPLILPTLVAELDTLQQALVNALMAAATSRTPGGGQASNNKPSFITASGVLSAGTINV